MATFQTTNADVGTFNNVGHNQFNITNTNGAVQHIIGFIRVFYFKLMSRDQCCASHWLLRKVSRRLWPGHGMTFGWLDHNTAIGSRGSRYPSHLQGNTDRTDCRCSVARRREHSSITVITHVQYIHWPINISPISSSTLTSTSSSPSASKSSISYSCSSLSKLRIEDFANISTQWKWLKSKRDTMGVRPIVDCLTGAQSVSSSSTNCVEFHNELGWLRPYPLA